MAAGLSTAITLKPFRLFQSSQFSPKPIPTLFVTPLRTFPHNTIRRGRKMARFTVCVLMEDPKQSTGTEIEVKESPSETNSEAISARIGEKLARKRLERFTYLVAAVMSSFGITSMAVMAVYYRFSWQMEVFFLELLSLMVAH